MAAEVDLSEYTRKLASLQTDLQDTLELKLQNINEVVQEIEWYGFHPQLYSQAIGDITFEGMKSVSELVQDLVYTPIAQRQLLAGDYTQRNTHIFNSSSLEVIENKIVSLISSGGVNEVKNLTGVLLTDAIRSALIEGQDKADASLLNRMIALQNLYVSEDQAASLDYLTQRYSLKREDRQKNIFGELFDMAQKNIQWAYTQGIAIEALHADFTIKYCQLSLDLTTANIAVYKADSQAQLADFETKIKKQKTQLEIESLKLDKQSTEYGLRVEQANQRLAEYSQSYANSVATNLRLLEGRIIGSANVTNGYMKILGGYSGQFTGISRGSQ